MTQLAFPRIAGFDQRQIDLAFTGSIRLDGEVTEHADLARALKLGRTVQVRAVVEGDTRRLKDGAVVTRIALAVDRLESDPEPPPLAQLSARQREVLRLALGASDAGWTDSDTQVADDLLALLAEADERQAALA